MMRDSRTLKMRRLQCASSLHPLGLLAPAFQAGIFPRVRDGGSEMSKAGVGPFPFHSCRDGARAPELFPAKTAKDLPKPWKTGWMQSIPHSAPGQTWPFPGTPWG